jgi:hypothetical protein
VNFRECYLETLLFGSPERIPFMPGGPRESTLRAWHTQGLPQDRSWHEVLLDELQISPMPGGAEGLGLNSQMIPIFEEKVLEHKDGHYIVQDWMGAITEISDEYDYTYIRGAKDFVTRKWHKFPVETREDWEAMRARYDPETPERLPADYTGDYRRPPSENGILSIQVNGPFWQLREWCGFENLCMLFLDDPLFVREMVDFWKEFVLRLFERIGRHATVDRLGISEDMAYKAHSMISPEMTRRFLLPVYTEWVDSVRSLGCSVIDMDSDGCVEELIPIWIEAGINVCSPIEVAAHNDITAFRERFGTKMGYVGGVDKRAMAAGGAVIEAEMKRLTPVIRGGGYIPGCDHAVPADVSWPNFISYSRRLAELCGWM